MNQEKIGLFIKDIRKKNNLTQGEFANKLNVTHQAVSKWENGKSIPDIATLKLISEIFNVNIDELLEGGKKTTYKKVTLYSILLIVLILIISGIVLIYNRNHHDFEFKMISTTCKDFAINGSAAYNSDKTSIYISNITYCGKANNEIYKSLECSLYEKYYDNSTLVSKCDHVEKNATLEEFLEDVKINVDNYSATCKKFKDSYLYLEITAVTEEGSSTSYKIPIVLEDNC